VPSPDTAIQLLDAESTAGNMDAVALLANLYEIGVGVPKNETKAFQMHQRLANQGVKDSMYYVGKCYSKGLAGLQKNEQLGADWYRKASAAGSIAATGKLGACYIKGQGVPRDEVQGITLIQKAVEGGDPDSMHNLGVCFERGLGVPLDMSQAVYYYRMGANAGCAEAMHNLSICLASGKGVAANPAEAAMWKAKSTEAGTPLRGSEK